MKITEQTASGFRKYFMEYTVMALVVAVITLFGMVYNLNRFISDTLLTTIVKQETTIERNTDALNNFKK